MRMRRWLRIAVAAAVLAATAVACTAVNGLLTTTRELESAGFEDATVDYTPGEERVLVVTYRTRVTDLETLGAEYQRVARVVWDKAPLTFDALEVSAREAPGECTGTCTDRFTRADLVARFGARNASLDRDVDKQLLYVGAVAIAVIVAVIVAVITLVVRSRRKARAAPYAAPGYPGAPPGWAPQPTATITDAPDPVFPPATGYAPPTADNPAPARTAVGGQYPQPGSPPAPAPVLPPAPPPDPTHDIWARPPS
jgi:hypothetical protein